MASMWDKVKKNAGVAYNEIVKKPTQQTVNAVNQVHATAVKQPTIATAKAVQTGSVKPLINNAVNNWGQAKVNASNMWGQVKDLGKNIGNTIGIIPQKKTVNDGTNYPVSAPAVYGTKMMLSGVGGDQITQDFGGLVGANENAATAKAGIASQYGQLGSLAKMREGAQRQTEQSAIQRRLAASGMSGSGAGMRLAGQSEQAAGRRGAETQLGIGAEQAQAERQAQDAVTGRNLQREGMRVGAAESAAQRQFGVQQATRQGEMETAKFEQDKAVTLENQKIAREMQRYNESGLLGQLGQDIFGSMGKKFGTGTNSGRWTTATGGLYNG